ncbi:hypothetical protein SODALDRAFT_222202 [Sodiomyces alkalinus F11]|uniref:Uncharacterized protein n=1 Tax=Sodiomyces alkalinus (strain CBS 110278 / VKM F-3762 / F11) TaxID=1314773 RepID=A0A3N2PPZ0_SODAK|nr:hypothetical protein SODALDRAFT_222202 [Sodiomyces alkalinus F11]ROT36569.1 hypothetical protein SODALDRAFT_222202 [Sodiomyces alkalinus F11]
MAHYQCLICTNILSSRSRKYSPPWKISPPDPILVSILPFFLSRCLFLLSIVSLSYEFLTRFRFSPLR